MMWKERYSSRVGGVAKMVGLLHNLFWVVLVGCLTYEYARTSFLEVWVRGYGNDSYLRDEFQPILRQISVGMAPP